MQLLVLLLLSYTKTPDDSVAEVMRKVSAADAPSDLAVTAAIVVVGTVALVVTDDPAECAAVSAAVVATP